MTMTLGEFFLSLSWTRSKLKSCFRVQEPYIKQEKNSGSRVDRPLNNFPRNMCFDPGFGQNSLAETRQHGVHLGQGAKE